MLNTAKAVLKDVSYRTGVLGAYHSLRNRGLLTVAMFHRVLPTTDPRYAGADPEWTIAPELFFECVAFFRRHYNIVSPEQVFSAIRGEAKLPGCSLLITFDDGWADTAEYAQPILDEFSLSALVFVAGNAVNQTTPFWEERVYSYLATQPNALARLESAFTEQGIRLALPTQENLDEQGIRAVIKQLSLHDQSALDAVTRNLISSYVMPAAMMDSAALLAMRNRSHTIGAHGLTHQPLTRVVDAEDELKCAKKMLAEQLSGQAIESMSFPHGAYSDSIVKQCKSAGYKYLFSSKAHLNDVGVGQWNGTPVGRIHISARALMDVKGKFRPALLATWLFLRPVNRRAKLIG